MESPGLIWIPTGTAASNLRYLTAHEVAHQWFYGIVGNDQVREPFTDEALADFAARSVLGGQRGSRCPTRPLDRSIYDYTARCYYEIVYIQGGNLIEQARRAMGSELFWTTLRGFVEANRHQLVSTATLLRTLDDATPLDLAGLLFAARFPRIY
jgi:aminopeptidase N